MKLSARVFSSFVDQAVKERDVLQQFDGRGHAAILNDGVIGGEVEIEPVECELDVVTPRPRRGPRASISSSCPSA